jgi:hypothetical protein
MFDGGSMYFDFIRSTDIDNANVMNSIGHGAGGCLRIIGGNIIVRISLFQNCTSRPTTGSIRTGPLQTDIWNLDFPTRPSSAQVLGVGGGMAVFIPELFTLISSTVSGAKSLYDGGGIWINEFYTQGRVTLTDVTIDGCTSEDEGGGMYIVRKVKMRHF